MSTIEKGSSAYVSAHMWMRYHYGKPQECENCHTTDERMYHWANISGTYIRDREDWLRLCVPCHKAYDIKALGGRIKARPAMTQPTKVCAECSKVFSKKSRESHTQWAVKLYCGRKCGATVSGRARFGKPQSDETRALKSQKMVERWTNPEWRERISQKMKGNQHAAGRANPKQDATMKSNV